VPGIEYCQWQHGQHCIRIAMTCAICRGLDVPGSEARKWQHRQHCATTYMACIQGPFSFAQGQLPRCSRDTAQAAGGRCAGLGPRGHARTSAPTGPWAARWVSLLRSTALRDLLGEPCALAGGTAHVQGLTRHAAVLHGHWLVDTRCRPKLFGPA